MRKMRKVLTVCLAVLLLTVFGSLPVFASSETPPDIQATEEEQQDEITAEDKEAAKPIPGDAITIELGKVGIDTWKKYLYFDMSGDLSDNSQILWITLGASKENFDISVGWSQRLNEPEDGPPDRGTASVSCSIWW